MVYKDAKITFAERLKALREKRAISRQELADKLQITRQSLIYYEEAQRTINIDILLRICTVFEVSADYLLGLSETQTLEPKKREVLEATWLSEKAFDNLQNIAALSLPLLKIDYDLQNAVLSPDEQERYKSELKHNTNFDDEYIGKLFRKQARIIAPIEVLNAIMESKEWIDLTIRLSSYVSAINGAGKPSDNDYLLWQSQRQITNVIEKIMQILQLKKERE